VTFDRASSLKNTDDDTVSTVKFEKTEEEDNSERAVSEPHPYRSDTDKEYGRTGEKNGNVFYMEAYRRKMTSADSVSLTTEANPEPISAHFEIQQDDVEGPSKDFIRIMRTSLVEPILKFLRDVQHHACTPNAALYINKILYNIRELEDKSPDDPFLEVLSGLYMALAYENQWAN
jgi:hypothetical protein